jgi:hypothetical protein
MASSRSKETYALCLAIALALLIEPTISSASCFLPKAASSSQATSASNNWCLSFGTNTLAQYKDPGLAIAPVIESKITFNKKTDDQILAYEDLWYGSGELGACVGAKRHAALSIQASDFVTIDYTSSDQDVARINAAADTIARLLLDVHLNDASITSVTVPDQVFDRIAQNLGFYRIYHVGSETAPRDNGAFAFTLKSQSGVRTVTMQYCI